MQLWRSLVGILVKLSRSRREMVAKRSREVNSLNGAKTWPKISTWIVGPGDGIDKMQRIVLFESKEIKSRTEIDFWVDFMARPSYCVLCMSL
jgi:hypothetical protein